MKITSRIQAIQNKQTWYFTGIPCRRGHVAPRNTNSCNCHECWREDAAKIRKGDPIKFKRRKQEEYKKHRIEILQQQKHYRQLNWNEIYKRRKQNPFYQKYMNEYFKQYFKQTVPRAKQLARTRRRQIRLLQGTPFWLSQEDLAEIKNIYINAAEITVSTKILHVVDHIIPLQGKEVCGLHVPSNLRIITQTENNQKSNKLIEELLIMLS